MAGHLELPGGEISDEETGLLNRALHFGLQLRIWVALCVSSLAHFSYRAMETAPTTEGQTTLLGVVFLSAVAVYNLDGMIDLDRNLDAVGAREHTTASRRAQLLLTAISFVGLLLLVPKLPNRAALLTGLGLVGCCLYNLPHSSKSPQRGLKFVPGIKAPFVGISVASAVVWVTALAHPSPVNFPTAGILWLTLCTYCTANALLFDIPDLNEDAKSEVPTLPRSHGVTTTQRTAFNLALLGLLFCPLGILSYFGSAELISRSGEVVALSTLGIFLMFCSRRIDKNTRKSRIVWFVDGGLLLPALSYPLLIAVRDSFR
jgi:4-hydroxybenzoate polyprenyltransferase